jgi:hypothetical protein
VIVVTLNTGEVKKMDDVMVNFGGGIKSLEGNKIGGYLVLFSDEKSPDLAGDFFTKDTDFGIEDGAKSYLWFNHRRPIKTKDGKSIIVKEKIGEGELKMDDKGVFIEAVLYNRKQYEEALSAMGWSSGTAAHLVEREKKGTANFIKQWFLGMDASVTPIPCEPRTAVQSLKSLDGNFTSDFIIESDELKAIEKEPTEPEIKSDPLDAIIEPNLRAGLRFEQRLDLVLAANEQVINDAKEIHEMRKAQKAGRKISASRMTKLKELMTSLETLIADAEGAPAADDTTEKSVDQAVINSLVANFEYQKMMHQKSIA